MTEGNTNKTKENQKEENNDNLFLYHFYDAVNENIKKLIEENEKNQPMYIQSISNLQQDYLHCIHNMSKLTKDLQKRFETDILSKNSNKSDNYTNEMKKMSNSAVEKYIEIMKAGNQFTVNVLDSTRENIKNYNSAMIFMFESNMKLIDGWKNFNDQCLELMKKIKG